MNSHNNIEIKEQIPSTVVNILQAAHRKENQNKVVKLNKIGKNILQNLMPFQKDGVQYVNINKLEQKQKRLMKQAMKIQNMFFL